MTTPEEQPTVGDFLARLEFKYDNDVLDFLKTGKGVVVVEDKVANIPLPQGEKGDKGDIGQLREGDVRYFNRRTEEAEAAAEASEASAGRSKASEEAAKASETKAKTSETNAKDSETKASKSASDAHTYRQGALTYREGSKEHREAAEEAQAAAKSSETKAKASETEATFQAELSADSATLAITAAATVAQYVGDGFPEGKVTAPVGSIYTDRLATNGAVRWIKTQGTGNTGWQVEYGDTGWRDVTQHLQDPAPISGNFYIRRVNGVVSIRFDELTFEDTSAGFLQWNNLLPQGYNKGTPGFDFHELSAQHLHDSISGPLRLARAGAVVVYMYGSIKSNGVVRGTISYPAYGGWPHTSVGTPS